MGALGADYVRSRCAFPDRANEGCSRPGSRRCRGQTDAAQTRDRMRSQREGAL